MQLCDDGHEEVCYEGGDCPVCDMKSGNEELESDAESAADNQSEVDAVGEAIGDFAGNLKVSVNAVPTLQALQTMLERSVEELTTPWNGLASFKEYQDAVGQLGAVLTFLTNELPTPDTLAEWVSKLSDVSESLSSLHHTLRRR